MSKKKKKEKVYSSEQDEMMRMIKVFGSVVVVLIAFYLIFAIASGEISFGGKKKTTVEIQDVEILAGNSYSRSESSYYVLFYDFDKDDSVVYANIYDIFRSRSYDKMYLVDLSKKFNTRYLTDNDANVDISSIDNLKIVNGTLIKIENGQGVLKAIGKDQINNVLFTN